MTAGTAVGMIFAMFLALGLLLGGDVGGFDKGVYLVALSFLVVGAAIVLAPRDEEEIIR